MIDTAKHDIGRILSVWTEAERQADVGTLDAILTEDFVGIGPLGFTLPKAAWLARHRPGGLQYQSFDLTDVDTRIHGDFAIVTARQRAQGTHAGGPIPEALRTSLSLVNEGGAVRIAGIHMSFIAGTRGAPPMPGPASPPPGAEGGTRS